MAKILIVDDEPRFRRALRVALGTRGHDVIEASDGADALTCLRSHIPQVILLDWQMPGLDGLQTCREIRARFDVPIIMVTSRHKNGKTQALAAGASDFVTKPFELEDLLVHVNAALSR